MLNVNFVRGNQTLFESKTRQNFLKETQQNPIESRQTVNYNADNVKANFLPSLSFKGIHKDSVLGIETKIVGISKYQKNAERLYFRLQKRRDRREKEKVQLVLKSEKDNRKDPNAVAVYHVYRGKPQKLGYLNKNVSERIKPLMDEGYRFVPSVLYAAGGEREGFPYIGVKMRLEYLSNPDRSPNEVKVEKVRDAFKACKNDGSASAYREESIIHSTEYDRATKMKVDTERNEVSVYRMGWEQLHGDISSEPAIKNQRQHSQSQSFVDHVKNAVKTLSRKLNKD
jgi:hypothetical protein